MLMRLMRFRCLMTDWQDGYFNPLLGLNSKPIHLVIFSKTYFHQLLVGSILHSPFFICQIQKRKTKNNQKTNKCKSQQINNPRIFFEHSPKTKRRWVLPGYHDIWGPPPLLGHDGNSPALRHPQVQVVVHPQHLQTLYNTLVRMIVMMAGKIMTIFGSRTFDSQWWKLPAKMPLSKSITPWHQSEQIHNTWDCKFNLKPERFTTLLANKSDWTVESGEV